MHRVIITSFKDIYWSLHILLPGEFSFPFPFFFFPVRKEVDVIHRYPGTVIGGCLFCSSMLRGVSSFL